MALTIASLNVRGLRDNTKRREVFNWLRKKNYSAYMLQEVHCTENTNHVWSAEWGYQAIFSTYKSNKAGVCILFNNNFDFQIEKTYTDPQGRFIICDIKTNEKCFTLGNIYAPNEDNPTFFLDFFDHLADFKCDDIIIGGDYNLVLDLEKDKMGGLTKTHQNSVKVVQEFSEKLDLVDVWRILHPDTRTDGLPAEFYKVFWKDVSSTLISALNYAYETGKLSITQRRGIIKLIPKKDAEPFFIKNWRPLTLLNSDYKIAAKSIANRLKPLLPDLINYDQTGFIRGRFIGENIRLIDSVICYTKENNIPGLLLFLDFEKAFDTIEWPFIRKTFQHFGFGSSILKWLNLFYCCPESCVLNNGWASDFFEIQKGVRQGCPLSPYLFVLAVEVLAKAIRENKSIKGIFVNGKEIKLSQYADDTTLILDGTKESLIASLKTLDDFYEVSGLKLNDKKTEAFWIGANCNKDEISIVGRNFKWPKCKVKALGVWFSNDPEATATLNYNEKLDKVRNVLSCWKYRRLTLVGKITVLKSLVASQLVYVLSPLHTNVKIIKEVNKLFFSFLWNGKGDKIKRDIITNDYANGGLKMIDIQSFNKSLKATWIKKYLDEENQGKWKYFFDIELERFGGTIVLTSNLNKKDTIENLKIKNNFIKEILSIWAEVNFDENITSEKQFLEQTLWYNSLIRIDNCPVFYREWFDRGVTKVKHLKDEHNKFLSLAELQQKYSLKVCLLKYFGLVSALKSLWTTCKTNCIKNCDNYETFVVRLTEC